MAVAGGLLLRAVVTAQNEKCSLNRVNAVYSVTTPG